MDVGDLPNAAGYAGSGAAGPPVGTTTGWWTPTSTTTATPANTDVMNQLCRVCGEPAAGFHFGAFTCEGCKSFFGRTYNNLGSISECKNGGVCVINKKNRTACKACRLRKCLMVGMSKSGSRYGRRSNWFKIHCLLQEQSNQAQTRLKDPKSPYEKVFSSLDAANNNNNTNNFQERLQPKREEGPRPRELSLGAREMSRQADLARPHELLRPEASRFPMWRGPPFFHPALTHMQLLNAPFFPFQQQRFVVPYVNQVGVSQAVAVGLSSSSSESVSPRSTPSPKPEAIRDDPRAGRTANAATTDSSYDKSLAFLRSLGPEQEEPIDLSRKTGGKPEPEAEAFASGEERSSDGEDEEIQEPETGPPLDLTRKT